MPLRLLHAAFLLLAMACSKKSKPLDAGEPAAIPDKPGCAEKIAVRGHQTCALYGSGKTACWLSDVQESLANLGVKPKSIRMSENPATELYLGISTVCVKNTADELWCVGANAQGLPSIDPRTSYSKIPLRHPLGNVAKIEDLDPADSCALEDGKVLCWRSKEHLESRIYGKLPGRATQYVAGIDHACALLQDGQVWCIGSNLEGQLGSTRVAESKQEYSTRWTQGVYVRADLTGKATALAAGSNHTCALIEDGSVWCWGQNFSGEVGNGQVLACDKRMQNCDPGPVRTPSHVVGLVNATKIAAGGHTSCAVDVSGKVWCWGGNELLEFENAPQKEGSLTRPTLLPLPEPMTDVQTETGAQCALSVSKHVYCWGYSMLRRKHPVRIALDCEG